MTRPEKYLRGIWDIEKPAPPVDTDAREVAVSLADSGPRYVSADLEFAVGQRRSARLAMPPLSPLPAHLGT